MHQAAAAAAVLGVVNNGDTGIAQQSDGIGLMGLRCCGDPIVVAICQPVQLVPAVTLVLRQVCGPLLTLGCAVGVFENDSH